MVYVKQITGTHQPSFKRRYRENGTYNGYPAYQGGFTNRWIWFDLLTGGYVISQAPGTRSNATWDQTTPSSNPDGLYASSVTTCEGNPSVGPIKTAGQERICCIWESSNPIPVGWVLCDGTGGTPDLQTDWPPPSAAYVWIMHL